MNRKKLRSAVLLALCAVSMAYYGVCISFAHIGVSWLWIWPLFASFCLIRAVMLLLEEKGKLVWPKWLITTYRVLLAAGISCFVVTEGFILSGMTEEPEEDLDYLIVLGAAVRGDAPTSPLLLRIEKAAEYLLAHPDTTAIASGGRGNGENLSEAECIRNGLIARGVAPERVLMEDRSSDTAENIVNSFQMIGDGAKTGVVTNSFHVFRAKLAAKLLGHEVSGVPAKTLLPLGIHYTVREFFGTVELLLKYSRLS